VHALRSEKRKAGKDLVTLCSAEGQREPNQPDLVSETGCFRAEWSSYKWTYGLL